MLIKIIDLPLEIEEMAMNSGRGSPYHPDFAALTQICLFVFFVNRILLRRRKSGKSEHSSSPSTPARLLIWKFQEVDMGEIFNDPADELVPEFELHDMGRFDQQIYGGVEDNERARSYQLIAKTLREHIEKQSHFCSRDFYRIRQLKKDLCGVCNDYDNLVHEHRRNVKRLTEVEQENSILREQKNKDASQQVQLVRRLEWENVELTQALEARRIQEAELKQAIERLEQENVELRTGFKGLGNDATFFNNDIERLERDNMELREIVSTLQKREPLMNNDVARMENAKTLERENASLIEQLSELSNALVQVSLERDSRSSLPPFVSFACFAFSFGVVLVMAYLLV